MSQDPVKDVRQGARHRRFPHRSAADVDLLDALPPAAAREFDRLLRQQHDDERRHRAHCSVEADLGDRALEQAHARTASRWSHGPGGGRRRYTEGEPNA